MIFFHKVFTNVCYVYINNEYLSTRFPQPSNFLIVKETRWDVYRFVICYYHSHISSAPLLPCLLMLLAYLW